MQTRNSVEIVNSFWRDVWQSPQNPEAIHRYVSENFTMTSGGRGISGQENFKAWIKSFVAAVEGFTFHIVETFQNADGSRVASRWKITGKTGG